MGTQHSKFASKFVCTTPSLTCLALALLISFPVTSTYLPGNTPSQADARRLKIELKSVKAEAVTERHRSKTEMEEAQHIIKKITIERDELRVEIKLLNNVWKIIK